VQVPNRESPAGIEGGCIMPWKKGIVALVIILAGLQFIPVDRTNPPVTEEVDAPEAAKAILQRSCYDCHSNATRWPWYSYVAPASWLVASDVGEARQHLNFSEWDRYSDEDRRDKLGNIREEVESGDMPLWYYLLMHPDARLSPDDRSTLMNWVRDRRKSEE
jgi:cytochrome c551/c552